MSPFAPVLDRFFREVAPLEPGDRLLVAFSGGPDSTALLAALVPLVTARRCSLLAAHLDHGCDPGSAARAVAATELARRLGVAVRVERRTPSASDLQGASPEEALRRLRYGFLEEVAEQWGARWIVTGHTRDDQAETVVLRLLAGSGLDGLAAIAPRRGRLIRPLLDLDRATVHAGLPPELEPLRDPGNDSLRVPRVLVRKALLPEFEREEPGIGTALARLAAQARGAREALDRRLAVELEATAAPEAASFSAAAFVALPSSLQAAGLSALARLAGLARPLGREARRELLRQLASATDPADIALAEDPRIGCDGPGGLRVESRVGGRLLLTRVALRAPSVSGAFTYTLGLPGIVAIPELKATVRIGREPVVDWMFRGEPTRAALAFELPPEATVIVRSRLPGDRFQPLGAPGKRKLKDVLIDHRVPREHRDRLPLVVVDGRIAWVPGVTIDEAFRVHPESPSAWVVEVLEP